MDNYDVDKILRSIRQEDSSKTNDEVEKSSSEFLKKFNNEKKLRQEQEAQNDAKQKAQEEAKRIAEEKAKAEEEKRIAQERAKAEAEARRVAQEKARQEAEAKRIAEEMAKAEAAKKAAEEKAKAEQEARRVAQEKARAEEQRITQEKAAKEKFEEPVIQVEELKADIAEDPFAMPEAPLIYDDFSMSEGEVDKVALEEDNIEGRALKELEKNKKIKLIRNIIIGILVLGIVAGGGFYGSKFIDKKQDTAYIKTYEKKYGVAYPNGIREDMCDAYGKNQEVIGSIKFGDVDTTEYVYSSKEFGNTYAFDGTDVSKDQYCSSISLDKTACDIEKLYSTPEAYMNASQRLVYTTLYKKMEYKVIGCFYTNTNPRDDNGYVFPYNFCGNMTEGSFRDYRDRLKYRFGYDTANKMRVGLHILTISTDTDYRENFKFVIVAIEVDEKNDERSTYADVRENVHYPQVIYDEQNKENPFKMSSKWYPIEILDNGTKEQKTVNDYINQN